MKALVVAIVAVAIVLLIVGLAVETLGFLLGVAPVLVVVAVILLLLSRFRGRRIPR
jgi:fucose permease